MSDPVLVLAASGAVASFRPSRKTFKTRKFTRSNAFLLADIFPLSLSPSYFACNAASFSAIFLPSVRTSSGRSASRASSSPIGVEIYSPFLTRRTVMMIHIIRYPVDNPVRCEADLPAKQSRVYNLLVLERHPHVCFTLVRALQGLISRQNMF